MYAAAAKHARAAAGSGLIGVAGQRELTRAQTGAGGSGGVGVMKHAADLATALQKMRRLKKASCDKLCMTKEEREAAIRDAEAAVRACEQQMRVAAVVEQTDSKVLTGLCAATAAAPAEDTAAADCASATGCGARLSLMDSYCARCGCRQ